MSSANKTLPGHSKNGTCVDVREFRRVKYFYGQMLGVQDFQAEQDFFREKLKLHNRCLHGYGAVCGLLVEPVPIAKDCTSEEEEEERKLVQELDDLLEQKAAASAAATASAGATAATATPASAPGSAAHSAPTGGGPATAAPAATTSASPAPAPAPSAADLDARIEELRRRLGEHYKKCCKEAPRTRIRVTCGLALDCHGNELVVRRPLIIDLLAHLSASDLQRMKQGADTLYVSICYCEQPVDPVRPVLQDACGGMSDCTYGKLQDSVGVQLTVDPPVPDHRCGTCCEACATECLLLARLDGVCLGHPLREHHIHNGVRRALGTYQPTTITGISWVNGYNYMQDQAKHVMGTRFRDHHLSRGLEVRFSRPVRADTIHRGVMDTWVVEGGREGNIYNKPGEFVDKPKEGFVDRIFYRDRTDLTLEPGDRVIVNLRTEFILDECCRPVDGWNVGGRVPLIREYAEHHHLREREHEHECHIPPCGYGPWTSGLGMPGGRFESWFFIREDEREP
jgi:hypothetical protein